MGYPTYTPFSCDQALFRFKEAVRELEKTPLTHNLRQELADFVLRVETELDIRDIPDNT